MVAPSKPTPAVAPPAMPTISPESNLPAAEPMRQRKSKLLDRTIVVDVLLTVNTRGQPISCLSKKP